MKIVMTDCQTVTQGDLDLSPFDALGEVVLYNLTPEDKIHERIKDADAVICNKTVLNESNLKGTKVKYIGLFATGYNNIDIDYCRENGIIVCNAGSYSTEAVAQHTFAFILNYYNRVSEYTDFVKKDGWKKSETFSPFVFPLSELKDKTIGIVGFGKIGQEVAKIAKAFSMNVLVYARTKREFEGARFVSLDELIKESHIVTVHCPLNRDSEKMFGYEMFKKMRRDALFINTARGGVMVEEDLIRALNEEIIAGAGIDVLEEEPMNTNSNLPEAKNIMITPHIAWAPMETRNRVVAVASGNLKNYIDGHPTNVVNL